MDKMLTWQVYTNKDCRIHNSWLYCFTNPLGVGTRVRFRIVSRMCQLEEEDDTKAKHVSQVHED